MKLSQKNIFLLGSQEEYSLLKEWSKKEKQYHLNGWFHDKDIPASPKELV